MKGLVTVYRLFLTLVVGICLVVVTAQAQLFSLAAPHQTRFIDKQEINSTIFTGTLYKYESELDKEQILDFYRDSFKREGYKQMDVKDEDAQTIVATFFNEKTRQTRRIVFSPGVKEGTIRFFLQVGTSEIDNKLYIKPPNQPCCGPLDVTAALTKIARAPRQPEFMPLFHEMQELEYIEWKNTNAVSAGYISQVDADKAIKFYLQEMPSYGWSLAERTNHAGWYTIDKWFPIVAPDSAFVPADFPSLVKTIPPLSMRGATLTFKRDNEKCVVTVHTFDNADKILRNHPYNLSALEKFGTTIISVMYYR